MSADRGSARDEGAAGSGSQSLRDYYTSVLARFSKKIDNLGYAVALHYMWYNFARIHKTLRITPRDLLLSRELFFLG